MLKILPKSVNLFSQYELFVQKYEAQGATFESAKRELEAMLLQQPFKKWDEVNLPLSPDIYADF